MQAHHAHLGDAAARWLHTQRLFHRLIVDERRAGVVALRIVDPVVAARRVGAQLLPRRLDLDRAVEAVVGTVVGKNDGLADRALVIVGAGIGRRRLARGIDGKPSRSASSGARWGSGEIALPTVCSNLPSGSATKRVWLQESVPGGLVQIEETITSVFWL